MGQLTGQTVLVTGASSGFGRAIALACAQEGADLALVARSQQRLEDVAALARAEGVRALVLVADVAVEAEVFAAATKAQQELGQIDVLVNNAGTNMLQRRILDTSVAQWNELLAVNLTSAFLFTKVLLADMMTRQRGTIINLASRAAIYPDLPSGVGYATSKMGLDALTRITNEEGNPHNVRACLLCPGVGNTPLIDRRPVPPSAEQRLVMLQPEDIAATVVLIAALPQRVNIEQIVLKPTRLP